MNPLEINELQKAMICRGVDYETSEQIIQDFRWRCENLLEKTNGDKMRTLPDEELVEYMNGGPWCDDSCYETEGLSCRECTLRWLKHPHKED